MTIDLHTHTNSSDAYLTRSELLEAAVAEGVDTIAITDHDTMRSSYVTPEDPIRIIEGVELSSQDEKARMVHVLCYLPHHREGLDEYFDMIRARRKQAGEVMLERVQKLYPVVTRERVAKYNYNNFATHKQDIMNVLIDFGYTDRLYGDLFRELFNRKTGSCIDAFPYEDTREMIMLAHEVGGVVVIAHAGESGVIDLVERFASEGLIDGAEVNHPRNTPEDRAAIREICERYNLIQTGGSDYHGRNNSRIVLPGTCTTTQENLDRILELSYKRR